MRDRSYLLGASLLALSACTTPSVTPDPTPTPPAASCPDALQLKPLFAWAPQEGQPRRLFVALHLFNAEDDPWLKQYWDNRELSDSYADYMERIDAETARPYGVEPLAGPLWLLSTEEPCQATPGELQALVWDPNGTTHTILVQELDGCDVERHRQGFAVQQQEAPATCRYVGSTRFNVDQPPPAEPLPAEVNTLFEPATCQEPRCVIKREFEVTDGPGGMRVVALTGTRYNLQDDGYVDCDTATDVHTAFIRASADGPWLTWPQSHGGTGIIYDARGLRAVVSDYAGLLEVFTPEPGAAEPRSIQRVYWYASIDEEPDRPTLYPCGL